MIEIEWAKSPSFSSSSLDSITLTVKFAHIESPVEFTASEHDSTEHGKEIFAAAMAGEYGEVAPVSSELIQAVLLAESSTNRRKQMQLCFERAQHWDMFDNPEQAQAWREYYRQLFELTKLDTWPVVEVWPNAPAE